MNETLNQAESRLSGSMKELEAELNLLRLVREFSSAMYTKLAEKMTDKDGWDDPSWSVEEVRRDLLDHMKKDDPVDIANYAAFWWYKIIKNNTAGKDGK